MQKCVYLRHDHKDDRISIFKSKLSLAGEMEEMGDEEREEKEKLDEW